MRNVSTVGGAPLSELMEGSYWIEVLQMLKLELGDRFDSFQFLFYTLPSYTEPIKFDKVDPNTVLVVLSDNSRHHYLDQFKSFVAVFKVHMAEEKGNVFPVPLGFTNAHLHESKDVVLTRPSNVFFSGNINAFRVDLWRSLRFSKPFPRKNINSRYLHRLLVWIIRRFKLASCFDKTFPESYIRFTSGFATGMGAEEYSKRLATSKISISPHGFWRAECFRHFEAMRAGSIIISDKLPETWYFKNSPIIQIDQWSNLREVVMALLADNEKLLSLQDQTIAWWKNHCSPKAVAAYMAGKILATRSVQQQQLTHETGIPNF